MLVSKNGAFNDRGDALFDLSLFYEVLNIKPENQVSTPFYLQAESLFLTVKLTPKGGKDAIEGLHQSAEGQTFLKARVRAAPENNAANEALIALLSHVFKLPKTTFSIHQGATSRLKILRIENFQTK